MLNQTIAEARTVRDLLDRAEALYGKETALCTDTGSGLSETDYRTFVREIRGMAVLFADRYGQGKTIALPGNETAAWLMLFFCILYSGNIAVPTDLSSGDEETVRKLRKLGPDLLFGEQAFASAGGKLKEAFPEAYSGTVEDCLAGLRAALPAAEGKAVPGTLKPDDSAVLIFTSGTTGDNKIVELTHRNICADAVLSVTYLDSAHQPSARVLSALPVFHMYGITASVLGSVCRGFSQCIGGGAWSLKKDLQKFRPEILLVVPVIIYNFGKKLLPAAEQPVTPEAAEAAKNAAVQFFGGKLKTVITGGAPLEAGYREFFGALGIFLMNGYGITECSPVVSCDTALFHRDGAIGKTGILPEVCTVRTMDGEICVRGEIVSPGYWKEPELNSRVYENGWFRTGDLGRLDDEGYLYITGRKKNILILPDGNNISMDELDAQLTACPAVDSAVVSGSVSAGTAVLKAVVYPVKDGRSPEELREEIGRWIDEMNRSGPRYRRIADFELTDRPFERTALGKIRRFKYTAPV